MKPGGKLPLVEAGTWRRGPHRDGEGALAKTKLPKRPDKEAANRPSSKRGVKFNSHGLALVLQLATDKTIQRCPATNDKKPTSRG
jgi:hypothetical protein